ncbi:MAG: hypothetical protein KGZ52_00340 [Xanthomonadaceae bacterium]|nr:hypothetical protein [Xanthomonadaceae bacterium]
MAQIDHLVDAAAKEIVGGGAGKRVSLSTASSAARSAGLRAWLEAHLEHVQAAIDGFLPSRP